MLDGFTKNIAQGLRSTNMINSIAASAWIAAMVGAVFTSPLLYVASVVQVALAQRRVGRFGFVTAVAYPLTALIFVVVVVRSALVGLGVGRVSWAGRRLP
jgi:formate/nitrite transporter FocA (FNT family)